MAMLLSWKTDELKAESKGQSAKSEVQ